MVWYDASTNASITILRRIVTSHDTKFAYFSADQTHSIHAEFYALAKRRVTMAGHSANYPKK
jgi:hypothetical protein